MTKLVHDIALRRAAFLLDEARSKNPKRDGAVRAAERCLSNYLTTGVDGTSEVVKKANPWMSLSSYNLAVELGEFKKWHKETMNEHEVELAGIWRQLTERAHSLLPDEVCALYIRPFITVTKDEDLLLRKSAQAIRGSERESITSRYGAVGIAVGRADGIWSGSALRKDPPQWTLRSV